MGASWSEVLDLYGRALLDFERDLQSGDAATPRFDFQIPSGMGPMPAAVASVAAEVAALAARVEVEVRDALAVASHERSALSRARSRLPRERPRARFVDVDA